MTCGPINGRDGGGVFFEYGGTPRKMYVALNAVANMLGPAPKPLPPIESEGRLHAYLFETTGGAVAIAWSPNDQSFSLPLGDHVAATDMMGNAIHKTKIEVGSTPVYFTAPDADSLRKMLLPQSTTQ